MATLTLNKNTSLLTYSDYTYAKAALRLSELSVTTPAQKIVRRHDLPTIEAVLVQPAWYLGRLAAYTAVQGATLSESQTVVSDDYLGNNLSNMVDLIRGHAQTTGGLRRTTEAGLTNSSFKTFVFVNSAKSETDADAPLAPGEVADVLKQYGGKVVGYLMHPALYAALAAVPQATGYAGTGNGKVSIQLKPGTAITENIIATALTATTFSVTGTTSGSYATNTVGVKEETTHFFLTITAGTVAFIAGDQFTIPSYPAPF